jgi:hypothetical protein
MCLNRLAYTVSVVPPETPRNDHRMGDICTDLPLTAESARSVRDAAIAVRYHGVKYLPVVDDGRLVGIVAVREQPRRRRDPGLGSERHASDGAADASGTRTHSSDLVVRDDR